MQLNFYINNRYLLQAFIEIGHIFIIHIRVFHIKDVLNYFFNKSHFTNLSDT